MRILTFAPLPWGASPLGWVGVALVRPLPAPLRVGAPVGVSPVGGLRRPAGWGPCWGLAGLSASPLAPLRPSPWGLGFKPV